MKLRWAVAGSLVPLGVVLGVLVVGPPQSVENDVPGLEAPVPTSAATTSTVRVETGPPLEETTTTSSTSTAPALTAATTTAPITVAPLTLEQRADVRVLLVNASRVPGAAGDREPLLQAVGFVQIGATDALPEVTGTTGQATTFVAYRPGFEAAAGLIADVLGIPGTAVQQYPDVAQSPRDDDGDVIVIIGLDLAG